MRRRAGIERIVSLAFVVCLFVPLLASIFQEDLEISTSEKRKLEQLPDITLDYSILQTFPEQFEGYYDDHFGFKNDMVRLHNYVLAKAFKRTQTPGIVIGSNNWLFYDGDGATADYIGLTSYREATLERFKYVLQDRKRWLDSLGTHYLFLPIPNKINVYDDQLPSRIRRYSGVTKYDQIIGYLQGTEGFKNFIDAQTILREGKKSFPTFLQTDSHWNHDGVYLVYREVMDRLQPWLPGLTPLQQSANKTWIEGFSGDLAIMMNLKGLITETAPQINIERSCRLIPPTPMFSLKKIKEYRNLPTYRLPEVSGCDKGRYTAVFIHDSFGDFLRPYFSQHFKKIIYVHYLNFEDAKGIIERERPDVVIDQRAARNLQRALEPDPELEQRFVSDRFDVLASPLTELNGRQLNEAIVYRYKVSTSVRADEAVVNFAEAKSTVSLLMPLNRPPEGIAALKLIADSLQEMDVQICYAASGSNQEDEFQCGMRTLMPGENTLFFRIFEPQPSGVLSIVAERGGTVALKGIAVKAE